MSSSLESRSRSEPSVLAVPLGPVGELAPSLEIRTRRSARRTLGLELLVGQPLVLAFIPEWRVDAAPEEAIAALRAELRGLGAALIIVSDACVWCFHPDDELQLCATRDDLKAKDLDRLRARYGACSKENRGAILLYVIDADNLVRFGRRAALTDADPTCDLVDALGQAARQLIDTPQPRWTISRRELVVVSLATAFAYSFASSCAPLRATHAEPAPRAQPGSGDAEATEVTLQVNGKLRGAGTVDGQGPF